MTTEAQQAQQMEQAERIERFVRKRGGMLKPTALDSALLAGAEAIRQQQKDHGAGLIHQVASPLAGTEPRLSIPDRVTVAKQQDYSDYFAEKAEDFDTELSRVPKDKRRKIRWIRDAHFAAAMALRDDVPLLDKDAGAWVVKHTIMAAGRTRTEALRALASAVGLTAATWPPRNGENPSPSLSEASPVGQLDLSPLKAACDRSWADETPQQIVSIAANAIYWRDQEIAKLKAERSSPSGLAELTAIKDRLTRMEHIVPSELSPDDQACRNGEYVSLFDVMQWIDQRLAALLLGEKET